MCDSSRVNNITRSQSLAAECVCRARARALIVAPWDFIQIFASTDITHITGSKGTLSDTHTHTYTQTLSETHTLDICVVFDVFVYVHGVALARCLLRGDGSRARVKCTCALRRNMRAIDSVCVCVCLWCAPFRLACHNLICIKNTPR